MLQPTAQTAIPLPGDRISTGFDVTPRGGFDIVLVPHDSSIRVTQHGFDTAMSSSFVAGASICRSAGTLSGSGSAFVVHLSLVDARLLLGVPLGQLSNRLTALDAVDGRLARRLVDAASMPPSQRAEAVARVCFERREADRASFPLMAEAGLRRIHQTGGRERISALAASLSVSRRSLERAFMDRFGLSPKALSGLARMQLAERLLRQGLTIAETAVAAGYFDQAHFCRDLKRIAGKAPSRFVGD